MYIKQSIAPAISTIFKSYKQLVILFLLSLIAGPCMPLMAMQPEKYEIMEFSSQEPTHTEYCATTPGCSYDSATKRMVTKDTDEPPTQYALALGGALLDIPKRDPNIEQPLPANCACIFSATPGLVPSCPESVSWLVHHTLKYLQKGPLRSTCTDRFDGIAYTLVKQAVTEHCALGTEKEKEKNNRSYSHGTITCGITIPKNDRTANNELAFAAFAEALHGYRADHPYKLKTPIQAARKNTAKESTITTQPEANNSALTNTQDSPVSQPSAAPVVVAPRPGNQAQAMCKGMLVFFLVMAFLAETTQVITEFAF